VSRQGPTSRPFRISIDKRWVQSNLYVQQNLKHNDSTTQLCILLNKFKGSIQQWVYQSSSFEFFFGDEYWKQCTLLCLNIHLQWKAKKRRWFKNSLMSWAFKVAKQMWDCVAIYTKQLKGVKKLKVEFLCLILSYIITDILILQILCKREPNTKNLFTASLLL
jgi:hypothetical protein